MSQNMQKYRVRRDGKKDLSFTGINIAEASDHEHQGPQNTRWSEIEIYKTDSGKYVVAQVYRTRWQGEEDSHRAEVCESPADVLELLSWEDEDGNNGISNMAKEALETAAENDSAFEGLTTEEV
ncbi:MAG: hypothetical protein M1455_08090 [Actinobacteria bacterium]|nr:hypothetical protein [Actinomycetota bacterium]